MLNQAVQRAQPPTRSSSLRCQSSSATGSSLTGDPSGTTAVQSRPQSVGGGSAAAGGTRLAVELQRLHELKRQVAAQEQRLATLRGGTASASTAPSSTLSDSNGSVSHGQQLVTMYCSRIYCKVTANAPLVRVQKNPVFLKA